MKIKSIAAICKKNKNIAIFERYSDDGDILTQYIGDGSAVYPVVGLPRITRRKRTGFHKAGIAAARYSVIRLTDARSASGFKRLSRKRGGYPIVLLIPARTDTAYFHDYIYGKAEIRFVRGRLRFTDDDGNAADPAPFPSMVVILRPSRRRQLEQWRSRRGARRQLEQLPVEREHEHRRAVRL